MHRYKQINLTSLRERAEKAIERSAEEMLTSPESARTNDTHQLIEELRVYQTELEIQNQELSSAQGEISLMLEKYRNLFENLPLPGIIIDSQGFVIETNLLASNWLGIRRNGLSHQRSIMQLFDSDGRSEIYKALRERDSSAPKIIELLHLKFGDGQIVPCDVHIIHLHEEAEHNDRTLMVLVDRSAETALHESEAFKDAILDSMQAQIAVLDSKGVIVAVNEAWRRFAIENGAPSDMNLHIGVRYQDVCQSCIEGEPDEGALEAYNGIGMVLDGRLSSFRVDYPCHSPTEERWFSMSASLLGGHGRGVVITHTNITESKKAEVALNAALEVAKQADQSKDAFFANITHELRTPLSAVIGFSSLARPLCSNQKQRDYLDKVNSAGKTLAEIIDDLLDLSKISAGHLKFEAEPFSLRQLVRRSLSVLSFKAEEKGLVLIEQVAEEIPDVLIGDALRVEQILLNLLGNAVKFTATGHVALRVKQLVCEGEQVCLAIEVEDTGIGMSDDEIGHLFKPFSQAGGFVTRHFGGTGLGLSICKKLVDAMGGEIGVNSSKGKGSNFQVKLCLAQAPTDELLPEVCTPAKEAAPLTYQGARVLVVDDQPLNCEVVEGFLALVGITPVLASNGKEAINTLQAARDNFDLVLMDIQMPVMDGLTATRQIRQMAGFANLPVIAMTAHTMEHEREMSQAAGMCGHIGKPFDEDEFYRLLAKWIPEAKQQRQLAVTSDPKTDGSFPSIAGIDIHAGLSLLLGNETRYRHWLSDFVTEGPAALTKIRQAMIADDAMSASMVAHSLKGRAGILGMKALHVIAGDLENALEDEKPTEELMLSLQKSIDSLCVEIERGLGLPVATPTAVGLSLEKLPAGPPPAAIVRLVSRLQAGDGDCDSFVADCLAELEGTPWAPRLQQASALIQRFDFASACKLFSDER